MSYDARFNGSTSREILSQLTKQEPSGSRLALLIKGYTSTITEWLDKARATLHAEFGKLAQECGIDPRRVYGETDRSIRLDRYKEYVPAWGRLLVRNLGNEEVLKIWDEDILSLRTEDPEALVVAIKAAILKIDALDSECTVNGVLKRTIDDIRSELTAELLPELVIDDARYKVGRQGVDARRDHLGFIIKTIREAVTVRDELLGFEKKAMADAAIEDAAGLAVENDYRIDWLGTRADCVMLIKFLRDNGYIETSRPNRYIAKHFSFKGEITTAVAIGKLQVDRDTGFIKSYDSLTIPEKKDKTPSKELYFRRWLRPSPVVSSLSFCLEIDFKGGERCRGT